MATHYRSLYPPNSFPQNVPNRNSNYLQNLVRDQFSIPAWLSIGAMAQGLLFLLPIRPYFALLPAFLFILIHTTDTLLVTLGLRRNVLMDRVLMQKYTTLLPDEAGEFSAGKSDGGNSDKHDTIVLLILGFRINHPLGLLAPGAQGMADSFNAMGKDLETNRKHNGFLGSSSYISADSNTAGNELMTLYYFDSMEKLLAWSNTPVHMAGWNFFHNNTKKAPHLAISHETYIVPRGNMENIYVNWEPSLLGTTKHLRKGPSGEDMWVSPLVDASKGKLASARGRLSAQK